MDEDDSGSLDDESVGAGRGDAGAFGVVTVGLVVGLVLGLLAALTLGSGDETTPYPAETLAPLEGMPDDLPEESSDAAEEFFAAWARSRSATYLAVTDWHRVTDLGAELRTTRVVVQRPPDRVRRAGGSVSGVADGVRYVCDEIDPAQFDAGDEGEDVTCQAVPDPDASFAAQVEREVALMWGYLEGTHPLYRVSLDDEGCYRLRLARSMLAPPYGVRSTFCFDQESGAVARFRIERPEGTDTEELRWVDTEVTDADVVGAVDGSLDLAARRP